MSKNYTCGEGDTLDTWKPSERDDGVILQSEWRKKQIGRNYNQRPGIGDVKKIKAYLQKKASDAEIMRVFGINAETLLAIKKDRYSPVEGILPEAAQRSLDGHRIDLLERAVKFIAEVLFIDEMAMEQYKDACGSIGSIKEYIKEHEDFDDDDFEE